MYIAVNMNGTKQWKFHDVKFTVYFIKHAYRVSKDQVLSSDDGDDEKEKGAKVERKTLDNFSVERVLVVRNDNLKYHRGVRVFFQKSTAEYRAD